ncbi:MAG TPA: MarR family transcriptional regulator [Candidatus Dormibacteraeota bacterium]|nr:MarR family transcriptional regulator [Candidatus Dormibacteraeota bacterium]
MTAAIPLDSGPAAERGPAPRPLLQEALQLLGDLACRHWRRSADSWGRRELSLLQLHVLATLQAHGPLPIGQLADLARMGAPSTSTLMDRLEEHGLVCRAREREDRRVVIVRLTDQGQALVDEAIGVKRASSERVLARLSDEELALALRLLRRVEAILIEQEAAAG